MEPFAPSFSEVGLDMEIGTELFRAFKITPGELAEPGTISKLKRIATYLSTQEFPVKVIRNVVMNNNSKTNNLDYLDSLVQLHNERGQALRKLVELTQDIKKYDGTSN